MSSRAQYTLLLSFAVIALLLGLWALLSYPAWTFMP
jgi:hypothetical protein